MGKLSPAEQKERAKDQRLQKVYGITLAEYNLMRLQQKGGCKICTSDGGVRSLHVDHDHKHKSVKVKTRKVEGIWQAEAVYRGENFSDVGTTKSSAIQRVRQEIKRCSVRGLICWPCNRLLRMAFDQPERLANAAKYLTEFQTFTASALTKGE